MCRGRRASTSRSTFDAALRSPILLRSRISYSRCATTTAWSRTSTASRSSARTSASSADRTPPAQPIRTRPTTSRSSTSRRSKPSRSRTEQPRDRRARRRSERRWVRDRGRAARPRDSRRGESTREDQGPGRVREQLVQRTPVQVVGIDLDGWDTHTNQAGALGQLFPMLAQGMQALSRDLRDLGDDVIVCSMTEFGRTSRENGSVGTDHAEATAMFVAGGGVRGGVYNCDSETWSSGDRLLDGERPVPRAPNGFPRRSRRDLPAALRRLGRGRSAVDSDLQRRGSGGSERIHAARFPRVGSNAAVVSGLLIRGSASWGRPRPRFASA